MNLAFKVFMRFEAPVYSHEGIKNFYDFVTDERLRAMFKEELYRMNVAESDGEIVGIISLRSETHISLLFVDEKYHMRGIGRKLVDSMVSYAREQGKNRLTVNSSPYAVDFYHRLGFCDLEPEQHKDGIIYTPMVYMF